MEQILTKLIRPRVFSLSDESGQSLVEYALILVLIAVASIVAVGAFGQTTLLVFWDRIQSDLITVLGFG